MEPELPAKMRIVEVDRWVTKKLLPFGNGSHSWIELSFDNGPGLMSMAVMFSRWSVKLGGTPLESSDACGQLMCDIRGLDTSQFIRRYTSLPMAYEATYRLMSFDLSYTRMSTEDMVVVCDALKRFSSLTSLSMRWIGMGKEQLNVLVDTLSVMKDNKIRCLNMTGNHLGTWWGAPSRVNELLELPKLESLSLRDCHLENVDIYHLSRRLLDHPTTTLHTLDIQNDDQLCPRVVDRFNIAVLYNTSLRECTMLRSYACRVRCRVSCGAVQPMNDVERDNRWREITKMSFVRSPQITKPTTWFGRLDDKLRQVLVPKEKMLHGQRRIAFIWCVLCTESV